jgi:MFS family permease
VGGEWAVATALVAEVFPRSARAWSLAIFHASSVLGTLLAVAAGVLVVGNPALGWRWGFVLGATPALLAIWIRRSLMGRETGAVSEPGLKRPAAGSWWQLFQAPLLRKSLVGVGLATVGLATFWGTHIYGKDKLRRSVEAEERQQVVSLRATAEGPEYGQQLAVRLKRWEMAGMFLVTCGGGLGLVAFGPFAEWFGRRGAFLIFHVGGLASAILLFLMLSGRVAVLLFLPVFGFLTLGMHAGYAVYFPELFPTALRSTGAGFCFNVARLLAAPILLVSGWLKKQAQWGFSLEKTAALLSLLFLAGIALLAAAPETRGQELPD